MLNMFKRSNGYVADKRRNGIFNESLTELYRFFKSFR